jgi:hypothetical protein
MGYSRLWDFTRSTQNPHHITTSRHISLKFKNVHSTFIYVPMLHGMRSVSPSSINTCRLVNMQTNIEVENVECSVSCSVEYKKSLDEHSSFLLDRFVYLVFFMHFI